MSTLLDVRDLTVRFGLPRPSMFAPKPYLEAVRSVSFTLENVSQIQLKRGAPEAALKTSLRALAVPRVPSPNLLWSHKADWK